MPLIKELHIDSHTRIGVWKIEESSEELRPRLIFSESEEIFMAKVTNEERRRQWMASRVLIKNMLGTTDFVETEVDQNGKPKLRNWDFNMSISHGHHYSAAILSNKYNVGIDVESARDKFDRLKQKFMRPDELATLNEGEEYLSQILVYWSAKEVMYKIYEQRKLDFRGHMGIEPFELAESKGELKGWVRKGDYDRYFDLHYIRWEDHMVVFSTDQPAEEPAVSNKVNVL